MQHGLCSPVVSLSMCKELPCATLPLEGAEAKAGDRFTERGILAGVAFPCFTKPLPGAKASSAAPDPKEKVTQDPRAPWNLPERVRRSPGWC